MKTVITAVGVSLLDTALSAQGRQRLHAFSPPSQADLTGLDHQLDSLSVEAAANLDDRVAEQMADRLVSVFRDLWDSQDTRYVADGGRQKRRSSPAELASLSLLHLQPGTPDRPPDGPDGLPDRIVLLYSETVRGAFCAAVLERMLREGVAVPADLAVEKQMVCGLQLKDLQRFTSSGLRSYTRAVQQIAAAQKSEASVLLNITGGYKGVAPVATIVALALGVEVCYLYEESDEMLFLPALDVTFGFSRLFSTYDPVMRAVTPHDLDDDLPIVPEDQVWEFVADEHRTKLEKYLDTADGYVQLSTLGVLAWVLHKLRPQLREARPGGGLTHE